MRKKSQPPPLAPDVESDYNCARVAMLTAMRSLVGEYDVALIVAAAACCLSEASFNFLVLDQEQHGSTEKGMAALLDMLDEILDQLDDRAKEIETSAVLADTSKTVN